VCSRRRLSTNSWLSLFLLLEWIHPSIDQPKKKRLVLIGNPQ
jgi:hypothetical protein